MSEKSKLFFVRNVAHKRASLRDIKETGSYRVFNDLDRGRYRHPGVGAALGRAPEREFSVPSKSIPVYPFIGTWGDLEAEINQRYKSKYPHHVIVGEIPFELINSGVIELRLNTPFSNEKWKQMDVGVTTIEGRKIVLDKAEVQGIVPELKRRIDLERRTPTLKSSGGWLGEAYIIDPEDKTSFENLPEVRVYQGTLEGAVLKYQMREGKVLITPEGSFKNIEDKG